MRWRASLLLMSAFFVIFLSGCAQQQVSPYYDDFVAAEQANSGNEFVRSVFANAVSSGAIQAEDYKESRNRVRECYEKHGLEVQVNDTFGLGIQDFSIMSDETGYIDDEAAQKCDEQFNGVVNHSISGMYYKQITNPQKQDMNQLIADCFVRKGLAPKGFDAQDYREFVDKNSAKCSNGKCTLPDGTEVDEDKLPAQTGDNILPGGKSASTFEASACRFAPLKD